MSQRRRLPHVDVDIDQEDPRGGVMAVLRAVRPRWRPEGVRLKTFTEGLTNRLLGCSVDQSDTVLVRLYGKKTELFVDRQREVEMFQVFHAHGCGPEIYCSFRNGLCYQFVEGTVLEDPLLYQPSIYRLIAAEVGRIHSIRTPCSRPPEPFLWTKVSHFLTLLRNSAGRSPVQTPRTKSPAAGQQLPSLATLSAEAESLERHLSLVDSPTVMCHNDLLTKNIIHDRKQGSVKFIDFEYADYNYQAYDIGNHFNEFAGTQDVDYSRYPSRQLQNAWLEAYLESYKRCRGQDVTVTQAEVTRLYVQVCKFSLASNFFWGLWAVLQSQSSSIDFDFHRYAMVRLNRYFEKKEEYFSLSL
ncbi:ethanolamine kinase 2 isoform X2 [Entelurus aequoreus]|uniref:ethanolamine kinase 2 isoform X2 n=1 Tax=Entelurus aequoreus TaxID=161455 RepID=UPI002B1E545C|nr:ethanolamine kinase 2 isoform X2 [Entelurus aequoreus]